MRIRRAAAAAKALAAALIAFSGTASARCEDTACGPLPGTATIAGGAAQYTIPILDPDDGAPYVALSYSTRAGSGEAGMGWSLDAAASIHRCPPTVTQDGRDDHVRYSTGDRLCDGGTRLVAVRGPYGRSQTVYVTEIERDHAVVQRGELGDGDSRFVRFGTAGDEHVYDEALIARGADAPLYWLRTAVRRADGREVSYHYRPVAAGEKVLDRIEWSDAGSLREVRFHYAPRRATSSFLAGGEVRSTQLLSRIEIEDGGTSPLEYQLSYRESRSSGRPLLERVEACRGAAEARRCGTPTLITWTDAPIAFHEPVHAGLPSGSETLAPAWAPGEAPPRVTTFSAADDFDADGFADVIMQRRDGVNAVLRFDVARRARGTPTPAPASLALATADDRATRGADLFNVGAMQLIGAIDGQIGVSGWRGDGFTDPVRLPLPHGGSVLAMDASGDGLPDLVGGRVEGGEFVIELHRNETIDGTTLRFAEPVPVARIARAAELSLADGEALGSGRHLVVRSAERIHRVIEFFSPSGGGLDHRVLTPESLGIARQGATDPLFADVNGDGLDDLVHGGADEPWRVQLNHDGRFGPPVATALVDARTSVARAATLVADIDSDGADELLFPEHRLLAFCIEREGHAPLCGDALAAVAPWMDFGVYRYTAIEFAIQADGTLVAARRELPGLLGQANRTRSADIDGDGYHEVFAAFDPGVANGRFRTADGTLHRCPVPRPCGLHVSGAAHTARADRRDAALDTVSAIARSAEETHRWHVYPLANPVRALYRAPALHAPERYLEPARFYFTSSMYVVGEYTAGGGAPRDVRLAYGGGSYHVQGRGFDGFQWITESDLIQGIKQTWWWRQVFPFRGELERTWVEKLSDDEQDPARGSPGTMYLEYAAFDLACWGPEGHPLSRRFGCEPSEAPVFRVESRLRSD